MRVLELDREQQAFADTIARVAERSGGQPTIDEVAELPALWPRLAELGVFGLGTHEGGGGAVEIVAVMEQLGRALVSGPLIGTMLGVQLLGGADRLAVAGGERVVTVAGESLVPWGTLADHIVVLDGHKAWLAEPAGDVEPVATMAGEPWARMELKHTECLGDAGSAIALGHLALAAYLTGAGFAVVDRAASYARDRKQFRVPIGDFQAVAHPLARCHVELTGTKHLAMLAATHHDEEPATARVLAASARLAACHAALHSAAVSHQVHGAIGFTVESGLGVASARIRQWTHLPPSTAVGSDPQANSRGAVT